MTPEQILHTAITTALENGWKAEIISKSYEKEEPITSVDFAVKDVKKHMDLLIGTFIQNPYALFDHEFARAFWRDGNIKYYPKKLELKGKTIILIDMAMLPKTMDIQEAMEAVDKRGYLPVDESDHKATWQFHLQTWLCHRSSFQ